MCLGCIPSYFVLVKKEFYAEIYQDYVNRYQFQTKMIILTDNEFQIKVKIIYLRVSVF